MHDRWITVVGQGRGGTSPLWYAIVDAVDRRGDSRLATYEVYRHSRFRAYDKHARDQWVIAKFLTNHPRFDTSLVEPFGHRFQITRDPRDSAVSVLLFSSTHLARRQQERVDPLAAEWIALLEKKEADPASVSVLQLYRKVFRILRRDIENVWAKRFEEPIEIAAQIGAHHVRLEDLWSGAATAVSEQLGLDVQLAEPPEQKQHVLRSGESSWRRWFTPRDVKYFRPLMLPFMERFGYDDDWELDPAPVISAEESSAYVRRTIENVRALTADVAAKDAPTEILRYRADHGSADSAYDLARRLVAQGTDLAEARERAVYAASARVRRAQRLAARMFHDGIGGPVDRAEAAYWRAASRSLRG